MNDTPEKPDRVRPRIGPQTPFPESREGGQQWEEEVVRPFYEALLTHCCAEMEIPEEWHENIRALIQQLGERHFREIGRAALLRNDGEPLSLLAKSRLNRAKETGRLPGEYSTRVAGLVAWQIGCGASIETIRDAMQEVAKKTGERKPEEIVPTLSFFLGKHEPETGRMR